MKNRIILSLFVCIAFACSKSSDTTPTPTTPNAPVVNGFEPTSGAIGDAIVINGNNFSTTLANNKVTINGIAAKLVKADNIRLIAIVPAGATSGKVAVEVNSLKGTSTTDYAVSAGEADKWKIQTIENAIDKNQVGFTAGVFNPTDKKMYISVQNASGITDVLYSYDPVTKEAKNLADISVAAGVALDVAKQVVYYADLFVPYIRRYDIKTKTTSYIDISTTVKKYGLTGQYLMGIVVTSSRIYINFNAPNGTSPILYIPIAGGTAQAINLPRNINAQTGLMAVDANDNVYLSNTENSNVVFYKIDAQDNVTKIAAMTDYDAVSHGNGGIAIDAKGNLFFSDVTNHTLYKITSGGKISLVAGQYSSKGKEDGNGLQATFNKPCSMTFDASGNLYVYELEGITIKKVNF